MPLARKVMFELASIALALALAACQPAAGRQSQTIVATAMPQSPAAVVWGRVPYCNCFAESATTNVADALKKANLTVSLKELSPRDSWLYFAVNFDPASVTWDQVSSAMLAGGAEVLEGPP